MTDIELDARVTALEENSGGGDSFNGKTHVFYYLMQEAYHLVSVIFLIEQFNCYAPKFWHRGANPR